MKLNKIKALYKSAYDYAYNMARKQWSPVTFLDSEEIEEDTSGYTIYIVPKSMAHYKYTGPARDLYDELYLTIAVADTLPKRINISNALDFNHVASVALRVISAVEVKNNLDLYGESNCNNSVELQSVGKTKIGHITEKRLNNKIVIIFTER